MFTLSSVHPLRHDDNEDSQSQTFSHGIVYSTANFLALCLSGTSMHTSTSRGMMVVLDVRQDVLFITSS